MNIQLTNYGVQRLQAGNIPLTISKYELGTEYGYAPVMDATGLKGELLYSGTPTEPETVDGNTIKYVIGLGYSLGDFTFGEIALYDELDKCVATAVSDVPITKQKYSSKKYGNSLVIDIYVSMTGRNYYAWVDELTSSNEFGIPILQTLDALPPPSESSPNFYIISPVSSNASSTLAYCTNKGLWNFDTYQYDSGKQLSITGGSYNSITLNASSLSKEEIAKLTPSYYGEVIVQFAASNLAGTCRVVQRTVTSGNKVTVMFKAPVTKVPNADDTIIVFSRKPSSVSNFILPVATQDTLGGVKIGAGLDITPEGVLSVSGDIPGSGSSSFVTSVNGKVGDVILKITDIENAHKVAETGSYNDLSDKPSSISQPNNLTQITDANEVKTPGIYTGTSATLVDNYPTTSNAPFTLEVIAQEDYILQRYNDGTCLAYRCYDGENWSSWVQALTTSSLPIASSTVLGAIKLGAGLEALEDGTVSASVTSVQGKTGDVEFTANDVFSLLKPFYNVQGGIPTLTPFVEGGTDQEEFESARLQERNLTFGALYMPQGTWDAARNALNGDASYKLMPKGKVMYKVSAYEYKEVSCKGWVVEVGTSGSVELDGCKEWTKGDLLLSTGTAWKKLGNNGNGGSGGTGGITFPDESGVLGYNSETGTLHKMNFLSDSLEITEEENEISFELNAQTNIVPGEYSTVTVNDKGVVVGASKGIYGGTF